MHRIVFHSVALLLLAAVAAPTTARAESEGFHYIPLRPSFEYAIGEKFYNELEFNVIYALLSEGVYRGSGDAEPMLGFGALLHGVWQQSRFVALSPQYGLDMFFGSPSDSSGGTRPRLSLQAPLGLHYIFQLYKDDRDPTGTRLGDNFVLYLGPLFPLTLDLTTDGYSTSGDLGLQVGLAFNRTFGSTLVQFKAAVSRFFTGYFYINDLAEDNLQQITGDVADYGLGAEWFYLPWRFGLGVDYHMTSSLGDLQGDTAYLGAVQIRYFPK